MLMLNLKMKEAIVHTPGKYMPVIKQVCCSDHTYTHTCIQVHTHTYIHTASLHAMARNSNSQCLTTTHEIEASLGEMTSTTVKTASLQPWAWRRMGTPTSSGGGP